MVGNTTNCAQIRERMFDAASDSLPGGIRAALDAHIGGCAACAKEFREMQTLAQVINQDLRTRLAVEPSPQLIGNVRRQIIAEPHRATWSRQRSAERATAGLCTVLAILMLTVLSVHESTRPTHEHAAGTINAPSTTKPTVAPLNAAVETPATAEPRNPAVPFVRHASLRTPRGKAAGPEVIVEPGQMQAILRLAAATESGQIDGAKLLIDQKNAAEPLTIKPIVIAPLKIAALEDQTTPSGKDDGDGRDFVAGHLH